MPDIGNVTMEELMKQTIGSNKEEFCEKIDLFLERYKDRKKFEELNKDDLRARLWNTLFEKLEQEGECLSICNRCLATLRLLSRDKTSLEELINESRINVILRYTDLIETHNERSAWFCVATEALKLLCNLLYNNEKVQRSTAIRKTLPHLIKRINDPDENIPYSIRLFDLKILFLITALNVSVRGTIKTEYRGDASLIQILERLYMQLQHENTLSKEENIILVCEILKILFNLYIQSDNSDEDEKRKNEKLVKILCKYLVSENLKMQDELQSNIVNLLTVVPYNCFASMIQPAINNDCNYVYKNMDLTVIAILLKFLDQKLGANINLVENICPIVTVFIKLVKSERLARKYVRLQVLPPLKDVMHRPEEGTTLRAKLCTLLTSPVTEVRDLVAEFLFVLCKENVNRMVKYTGYGNAAGMFANKGLLGHNLPKPIYSSDSENSDTEEYSKYKDSINPVTGCFEPPKPNPLEGMSEEQKEYEAMQLVDLVDKLTRGGIVHPCRIGEDGKPKPIEHVLELQEELPKQQYRRDSDSN